MISLISWIITGLVIGLIARAIVPGKQSMGFIMTVLLGVAGACVGGLISSAIWPTWANDPDVSRMWPGWLMAILGGILVVWGYSALSTDNRVRTRI
jgi:uncharacterized membrane protein YeaQ/YmgE (transglycosylase-associated protein family)